MRGRPRKGELEDSRPICERCKNRSNIPLMRINTNQISGAADWHRDSPAIYQLCDSCCKELSSIIDRWFIDGGGEPKYYCKKG